MICIYYQEIDNQSDISAIIRLFQVWDSNFIIDINVDNHVKLVNRMSIHQNEEYHITNHPMVEVPLASDQAGFKAADGNEMENGDPQKD